MNKGIILARVSTVKQQEEGLSLDNQIDILRSYAKKKHIKVIKEYKLSESADYKIRKRFNEIIDFVKKNDDIKSIIAYRVDRITRNYRDSVLMDDLRINHDKEIHFVYDHLVLNKKSVGRDIKDWDLQAFLAKQFINRLKEDAFITSNRKLKNGEYPGKAPYGYRNKQREDRKNWIYPEDFEAKIVKLMFEWYSTGSFSLNVIREKLNKEFNLKFHKGKIDHILKNPFYYGVMRYDGGLYPHKYEALISKELFDKVQEIKAGYHKKPVKFAGLPYLYRGIIKCGKCGCSFTPEKKKGKYVYYHCTEYFGKHGTAWIREEEITKQFANIFKDLKIPDDVAEGISQSLKNSHQAKVDFHTKLYNELENDYKKYESRLERMYEDYLDGRITRDVYDEKSQDYREKQSEIQARMRNLQKADEEYYITAKYILDVANRAYDVFVSSEPNIKRQILKLILQNCEIDNGNLRYSLNYPFSAIFSYTKCHNWLLG